MFASAVDMVRDVIDTQFEGISAAWLWQGFLEGLPVAHVRAKGGTQGFIDRHDRVEISVYTMNPVESQGGQLGALDIAEQLYSKLLAGPHYTTAGVIDSVEGERTPTLEAYTSSVDVASFSIFVTHRQVPLT